MDRNLIKYLPYEIRKYKDYQVITESENPEFTKLFKVSKVILDESFIETATDYGISRLEILLDVYPLESYTLEDRVKKLLIWWNNQVPYTWRILIEKLNAICGVGKYDIKLINDEYRIEIDSQLNSPNQYEDLRTLLDTIIPCNMVIISTNTLRSESIRDIYLGSSITELKKVSVDNNINVNNVITRKMSYGNVITESKSMSIDNNINTKLDVISDINIGHRISYLKIIKINMEGLN